jgi:hypothetical protein
MAEDDESTPQFTIVAVCTITDPAERQRRLTEAYDVILNFGRRKKVRTQPGPTDADNRADREGDHA